MLKPLSQRIKQPGVIVGDGAMGTMLFQRGLKRGACPEKMNLDSPQVLREVTRLYFESGAEICETNTFGASPLKLAAYGLENKTEEINARGVEAARSVIGDRGYVSGSCGPSGKILQPYGDTPDDVVYESFRRQLAAMVSAGVDMICIETMTDIREAALAVKAAKSVTSSTPVCACMTFDPTPKGFRTVMGTGIEQAVRELAQAGADIIGSNCGNGIVNMVSMAEQFRKSSTLPVIIQSNAGVPTLEEGHLVYPETPGFMAEQAKKLIEAGVKIIGGCCGTTPEHIAALAKVVREFFSGV